MNALFEWDDCLKELIVSVILKVWTIEYRNRKVLNFQNLYHLVPSLWYKNVVLLGHAIAKTVGHWCITVEDLGWGHDSLCGVCCEQIGMGAGVFDCCGYPVCVVPLVFHSHISFIYHQHCMIS